MANSSRDEVASSRGRPLSPLSSKFHFEFDIDRNAAVTDANVADVPDQYVSKTDADASAANINRYFVVDVPPALRSEGNECRYLSERFASKRSLFRFYSQ